MIKTKKKKVFLISWHALEDRKLRGDHRGLQLTCVSSGMSVRCEEDGTEWWGWGEGGGSWKASGSTVLNLPTLNSLQLQWKKKRERKKYVDIYLLVYLISDLDWTIPLKMHTGNTHKKLSCFWWFVLFALLHSDYCRSGSSWSWGAAIHHVLIVSLLQHTPFKWMGD